MTVKKVILFIHRWLGLISGLVVFIVSITGCIFCFQDEIEDAVHSYRTVEVQPSGYLKPSALKAIGQKAHPRAVTNYIYYYGKNRPAALLSFMGKAGYMYIYINPYTGQILHEEYQKGNFFTLIETIHLYLLLPPNIGKLVVGSSVLIFVVILITGIVLWWPKRKTDRKRSFTMKWKGKWRRVNYDLHNVLGFYATSVALILALSGLSIAFNWMRGGIYSAANLGQNYPAEKVYYKSDTLVTAIAKIPIIDKAFAIARQRSAQAEMFLIYDPSDKAGTIGVTAWQTSLHFYRSDGYTFDRYTGKLLKYLPHSQKSPGLKMNDMNYDIHVGQILGLTGKIIAFTASLICASLPVTGFIIWLGKRNKKKRRKPRSRLAMGGSSLYI